MGQKSQSCAFCLKIGTTGILRMLILIPTLALWISNSKFPFGKIWAKKGKVVHFAWKLAHMVSPECWFLFQHLLSEFQTKNQFLETFLGKFGPKSQICSFCQKMGTHCIPRMQILIPKLVFWISKPKSVRPRKWNCLFCLM